MSRRPAGPPVCVAGLAFLLASALAACQNEHAALGVSVVPPPQATVRFSSVWQILVEKGCTNCHGGSAVSAHMNLEKIFDRATRDPAGFNVGAVAVLSCEAPLLYRIAPFDGDGSYLIMKLKNTQATANCVSCAGWTIGASCGSMMPPSGSISDAIEIIHTWIDQGAQDN